MSWEIGLRIAALILVVLVVGGIIWRSTRIPVNRDASHDRWKDPDMGGGMS